MDTEQKLGQVNFENTEIQNEIERKGKEIKKLTHENRENHNVLSQKDSLLKQAQKEIQRLKKTVQDMPMGMESEMRTPSLKSPLRSPTRS